MKKRVVSVLLAATMVLSLTACGSRNDESSSEKKEAKEEVNIEDMSFDELKEEAKGSTVTFYGWGGDEKLNAWLDWLGAPASLRAFHHAWNGVADARATVPDLPRLNLAAWRDCVQTAHARQLAQPDLVDQLIGFVHEKR